MGEEEDPAKAALQLASETTWCIEFLDKQLEGGKLSEKKIKELRKAKKLLKAENTPLPQRRQVMRTQCGDYRAKMKAEEEAVKLDASKVTFNDVNVKGSSSNFIKKKTIERNCDAVSKTEFKFNFSPPENKS